MYTNSEGYMIQTACPFTHREKKTWYTVHTVWTCV